RQNWFSRSDKFTIRSAFPPPCRIIFHQDEYAPSIGRHIHRFGCGGRTQIIEGIYSAICHQQVTGTKELPIFFRNISCLTIHPSGTAVIGPASSRLLLLVCIAPV